MSSLSSNNLDLSGCAPKSAQCGQRSRKAQTEAVISPAEAAKSLYMTESSNKLRPVLESVIPAQQKSPCGVNKVGSSTEIEDALCRLSATVDEVLSISKTLIGRYTAVCRTEPAGRDEVTPRVYDVPLAREINERIETLSDALYILGTMYNTCELPPSK